MTPFSFEFHASTSLPSPPRFPLHTPTRQPPLACICVAAHGQSIIIFTIDTSRPLLQSPTASPTSNVNLHRSSSLSSRKFTRCRSWTPPDARCDSLGSPTPTPSLPSPIRTRLGGGVHPWFRGHRNAGRSEHRDCVIPGEGPLDGLVHLRGDEFVQCSCVGRHLTSWGRR
jgi:hypothetical protein